MDPSLSVCVPTHNGEVFLRDSVESVLRQDFDDYELLIVDDCSEDDSWGIARDLEDRRIRTFRNQKRLGLASNWNRCLDLASGRYVCIWHQDDLMLPGNLERKIKLLEEETRAGFVHSAVAQINELGVEVPGFPAWQSPNLQEDAVLHQPEALEYLLQRTNPICAPSVIARAECFRTLGAFDPRFAFAVDWDMWLRIASRYAVAYLADALVAYRWHGGQETSKAKKDALDIRETYKVRRVAIKRDPKRFVEKERALAVLRTEFVEDALDRAEHDFQQSPEGRSSKVLFFALALRPQTLFERRTLRIIKSSLRRRQHVPMAPKLSTSLTPHSGSPGRTRILLVSHEASLTGAPKVALEILRSLERNAFDPHVVMGSEGGLVKDFRELSTRSYVRPARKLLGLLYKLRITRSQHAASIVDHLVAFWVLLRIRPDLVYINSVLATQYLKPSLLLRKKAILHCHELHATLSTHFAKYRVGKKQASACTLVACSTGVRNALSHILEIPIEHVELVHEPVDPLVVRELSLEQAPLDRPSGFLIVACGTVDHRKGPDLWLEVANKVHSAVGRQATFLWVGTGSQLPDMRDRVRSLGLQQTIRFLGELENPLPVVAAADLVTVTSRADPFPLVCLEAMVLKKPIVAFDDGGLSEQLGETGVLISPFETGKMALSILELIEDEDRRLLLGSKAHDRATSLYGNDKFRADIKNLVKKVLGPPSV